MRLSHLGKKLSEETKEKLRLSSSGKKHSEETINKIKSFMLSYSGVQEVIFTIMKNLVAALIRMLL